MPRHCYFTLQVILIAALLSSLAACRNTPKQEPPFGFKDEKSMREALKGSWILKEYADSVDAGLTPKLLEYILKREQAVYYQAIDANEVTISSESNNQEVRYPVKFEFGTRRVFLFDHSSKAAKQIGTLQFVFDGIDTTLMFHSESEAKDSFEFIKYDMNKCSGFPDYMHLVNSKFIAGKYYNVSDTSSLHHIIFTRCGNVEGAENIAPDLTKGSYYEVQLGQFDAGGDVIRFRDAGDNGVAEMLWTVSKDSLILTSDVSNKKKAPIVLLKR